MYHQYRDCILAEIVAAQVASRRSSTCHPDLNSQVPTSPPRSSSPLPPHSPPPPPHTHEPPHLQLANSAPTNVGVGCARLSSWLEITAHFEQVLQTNFPKIEITFDYHGSVDSFPKAESIRHQTMVQLLLYFSASSQCNFVDQMVREGARSKCVPFKFYNPPSFLFYHLLQISRSLSLFAM